MAKEILRFAREDQTWDVADGWALSPSAQTSLRRLTSSTVTRAAGRSTS